MAAKGVAVTDVTTWAGIMNRLRQFSGFATAALTLTACAAQPPSWSVIELKAPVRTFFDGNAGRDTACLGPDQIGPTTVEYMRIVHIEIIDMRNGRHNTLLLTPLALASVDQGETMELRGDPGMDEVILDPSVEWSVTPAADSTPPSTRRYTVTTPAGPLSVDIPIGLRVHMAPSGPALAISRVIDSFFDANTVVGQVLDAFPVVLENVAVSVRISGIDMRNGLANLALVTPHTFARARNDMLRIAGDDNDIVVLDPRVHWRIEAASDDEWRVTHRRGYDQVGTLIVPRNLRLVDFGPMSADATQVEAPPFPGLVRFTGNPPSATRVRLPYGGRIRFVQGQVNGINGFDLTNDNPNTIVLSSDDVLRAPGGQTTVRGDGAQDAVQFAEPELWESSDDLPRTSPDGIAYHHYRLKRAGPPITLRVQADLTQPSLTPAAAVTAAVGFVDCDGKPVQLRRPAQEAPQATTE